MKSNPIALLLAASWAQLQRASAEISLTVNIDDLDPLKECKRRENQLVEANNKVYIYGGKSWVKNGTETPFPVVNHYLRIVDFTSARDLNDSAIMIAKDIPGQIPIFENGAYWSDSKKLHVVGGQVAPYPYLTRDGKFIDTVYGDFKGGTVYSYDIDGDKWLSESAVQPDSGPGVRDCFCCGSFAWNAQQETAYYYSGSNWCGARMADPNAITYAVFRSPDEVTGNGNQLSFDTTEFKWTNETTDNQLTTTWSEGGQYVFLPGTETSTGGVGILLGGMRKDSNTIESLRKILVYDSGTGAWYSQTTTAEDDTFPPNRINYCTVAASASDNSSHNIYVYGGESPEATLNAYSDMWILSVPSFRWIPVDVTSVQRKSLGCTKVAERYLVTYGGIQHGWQATGDEEDCDQTNYGLRLFDMWNLDWTSKYEGPGNAAYQVPSVVYKAIGGDEEGSATQTAPNSGFNTPGLESLFKKSGTTSTPPTPTGTAAPGRKKKSNIGAIVGGVIGGVAILAALIIGAYFLLKRRSNKATYVPAATSAPFEAQAHSRYPSELPGNGQRGEGVYETYGSHDQPPQELYADNTYPPP